MITPAASIAVPTPSVIWLAPSTATPCPGGRTREAVARQDCRTVSVCTSVYVSLRYRYSVIVLGQTGTGGSTQGEHVGLVVSGGCWQGGHVGLFGQLTVGQVPSLHGGQLAGLVGWMQGEGVSRGWLGQTGQSGGVGKSGEDGVSGQIGQLVATGTRMAV